MTHTDLVDALRGVQFLSELPAELLERLTVVSRFVEFPAGARIFRQGEPAQSIYLVLEGDVNLELCGPGVGCVQILTVGAGDLLGWSPVLEQARLTATARAATDTRAVEIDGPQLVALCEHDSRLGYEFMKRAALAMAKRLGATRLQLLNVYGEQMPQAPDEETTDTTH